MDNVNNLNGVPNFGHGFDSENEKVIAGVTDVGDEEATPAEEPEEEVEISNTEETE